MKTRMKVNRGHALITVLLFRTAFANSDCTTDPVCPLSQQTVVSSCTVNDTVGRATLWRGNSSVFGCNSGLISLSHGLEINTEGVCSPATARLVSRNDSSNYTSTLSVTPSPMMDGALIQCFYFSTDSLIQQCILNISDPPHPPECVPLTSADINGSSATSVLVTLKWSTPPSESPVTGYSIDITPLPVVYPSDCPASPCNVSSKITSLQFHFNLSTSYNISVLATNCDSTQLGEPRVFAVNLDVPRSEIVADNVSIEYEYSSRVLKNIFLSWEHVGSVDGSITGCGSDLFTAGDTRYEVVLSGNNDSVITSESNHSCCNYSYSPPSNSTNDEYNLALKAVNDVGVGQGFDLPPISKFNNLYEVNISLNVMNPEHPAVNFTCQFLDGVNGSCSITYGTDPNNLNLTIGPSQDVLELKDITDYEQYYFRVYADRGDAHITVSGTFTTCVCLNTIVDTACLERGYQSTCTPLPEPEVPTGCTVTIQGRVATYTCGGIYELVGDSKRVYTASAQWGQPPSSQVATWLTIVMVIIVCIGVILIAVIVIPTTFVIFKQRKNEIVPSTQSLELKEDPNKFHESKNENKDVKVKESEAKQSLKENQLPKSSTQSQSRTSTQSPPQTLPPSLQQQQQQSGGHIYADLDISNNKFQGQHQSWLQKGIPPEESVVTYSCIQDQQKASQ